ncbi:MAG: hypothetical protein ACXABD_14020 [Candidatus Thorarchaeota archaeon]|jgi:hypothetical protein
MPRNRTIKTFRLRQNFLSNVVDVSGHDNFYDSSTVKYYGKVNHNGDIVYPSEKYFRALPNPNKTSGNTFYVFNFVAKAFSDFRNYYIKGIATGIVKNDNTRLLEPILGWQSMHKLYAENIDGLYAVVINDYMQSPNQFFGSDSYYPKDFDHFMASFKKISNFTKGNIKLSRSSFVLSTSCPLSTTGLAIEIAPIIGKSNILKAINNFYYDENFDFYMKALKKFGFMADIDYPGRIVADIGSPAMQAYMQNFGITFDNLFERYYYKAGDYDYDLIKIYLQQFYNSYVTDYPLRTVVKNQGSVRTNKYSVQAANFKISNIPIPVANTRLMCEKTTTEIIRKSKLTQNDLNNKYDNSYWLNVYAEVLNYELDSVLDNYHLDKTMNNAQDINKNIDFDSAKSYVNEVFRNLRFPN